MSETNEHIKLKELAKNMLLNMGFKLDEIHEEYRIDVNSFTKGRHFVVDVCGISEKSRIGAIGKSVAIECGMTSAEKLVNLNLFFDEVYQLPYGLKKVDDFDKIYDEAIVEISNLKEQLVEHKRRIRELEMVERSYQEYRERWNQTIVLLKTVSDILFKYSSPMYNYVSDKEVADILDILFTDETRSLIGI